MNDSFESVSPDHNDQEANEGIDNDNRSDSHGSTLSSSADELDINESANEYNIAVDVVDDSEWTWDEMSATSEEEEEIDLDDDPWYPLEQKDRDLPNICLPDKTPSSSLPQSSAKHDVDISEDDETKSEKDDEEYQNALEIIRPNPSVLDLKKIVLDFFIWNGYEEPIEPFCREMGLEVPHDEIRLMHTRVSVKDLITEGNLQEAIKKLNEICPTLLDENKELSFNVRKQYIVEMIRQGLTEEPFMYARTYLLEDGPEIEPEKLEVLEQTFALMAYEPSDSSPFHYQYSQCERDKLARDVNSAILGKLGKRKFSKLETLTKLIAWARTETSYTPTLDPPQASQYWAQQSFETANQLDEFINLALARDPIDLSTEMG